MPSVMPTEFFYHHLACTKQKTRQFFCLVVALTRSSKPLPNERVPTSVARLWSPPDEKGDRALKDAIDLLRGTITDAAFPPNPKAAVPN